MSSDPTNINDNPTKGATEIFYPNSGDDPVEVGLPPEPTSRPVGNANRTQSTGIPNGVSPDDLPGMTDASSYTRRTLGQYLHGQTDQNITPVPSHPGLLGAIRSPITADEVSKASAFTPTSEINARTSPPPGVEDPYPEKPSFGAGGTANRLLHDVSGESLGGAYDNPESEYAGTSVGNVSAALSTNRFQPGNSFYNAAVRDNLTETYMATQRMKADGFNAPSLGVYNKNWDGVAVKELTTIAEQLMLTAVGDTTNEFSPGPGAAALDMGRGKQSPFIGGMQINGMAKIDADTDFSVGGIVGGIRANNPKLRLDMMGAMKTYSDPRVTGGEGFTQRKSFGQMNNYLEKFGGALPTAMILRALVGAISIIIVSLVLAAIFDVIAIVVSLATTGTLNAGMSPKPSYQIYPDGQTSQLPMGHAYGRNDFSDITILNDLYRYFNLPPLDAEYPGFTGAIRFVWATLNGVAEFFIGNSLQPPLQFPQIFTNSAGYYACVTRQAIRDWNQVAEANEGSDDVDPVAGFFALIDAFTTSATFKFFITMVQLGDKILAGPGLFANRNNSGVYGLPANFPEDNDNVDTTTDMLGSLIRIKSNQPRLAYSITALPQLFIRPVEHHHRTTADGAQKKLRQTTGVEHRVYKREDGKPFDISKVNGVDMGAIASSDILIGRSTFTAGEGEPGYFYNRLSYFENGRINTDTRRAIEENLDTYYMPFYFHDLRTNEIMPLPCFVSDISDSYSPKWSESSGFGRADPVQIYGGTSRKIGFSFYMVATSKDDYDVLWYMINRLVAMVYPQWSAGRTLTNSRGQTFSVPFSSVATASPIIRLRLGELFASNRAPENVRRLFGANKKGFSVGLKPEDSAFEFPHSNDEPGTLINPEELRKVYRHANTGVRIKNADVMLVHATQIIGAGGSPFLKNMAGCSYQGKGGILSTGNSQPVFLPAGIDIIVSHKKGPFRFAAWKTANYEVIKGFPKLRPVKGEVAYKIVNYYASTGDKGTTSDLYYVCEPIGSTLKEEYDKKKKRAEAKTGGSVKGVLIPIQHVMGIRCPEKVPEPPLLPPNPFAEELPIEEIVTDKAFFEDNMIVEAMKESGGMGLAGAITQLDFNWNEAPWETDGTQGRAPQFCRVAMSFSPIHDEPLGLNNDGSLRAAAYPVGDVIDTLMGKRYELPDYYEGEPASALAAAIAKIREEAAAEDDGAPSNVEG